MSRDIVTEPNDILEDHFNPQNPRIHEEFEETLEKLDCSLEDYKDDPDCVLETDEIVFFAIRCFTIFMCIIELILLIITIRNGNRLKSWRLYFIVALCTFSWLVMTLYQDTIDKHFVKDLVTFHSARSIYNCFQNLLHGLTLYLIILLLAHLSDMQRLFSWLLLIGTVIFIPLLYSVGLLIADLRLHPDIRLKWYTNLAIDSVRVFMYNIITTILMFVMSKSFCTRRLYGTYSEQRSDVVVLVARWTYSFLLIHNLIACASYALKVILRIPRSPDTSPGTIELQFGREMFEISEAQIVLISDALDEAALLVILLSVPTSYLVGMCGSSRDTVDMEMDKVDKIYTDVWTTPSARNGSIGTQMSTTSNAVSTNHSGLQNGVVARRRPEQSSSNISNASSLNSSFDSIGELPSSRIGSNPRGGNEAARKKRVRESYMEAVSMGSLDDRGSISSSEPIDL